MQNVMIDLETLGKGAGCPIVSIGAVGFGSEGLGAQFYRVINTPNQSTFKMYPDPETVEWWDKQSPEAREALDESLLSKAPSIVSVLFEFQNWLFDHYGEHVKVWGNGADFDNAILQYSFAAIGQRLPWKFYNNRCYRTLKNLAPHVRMERKGLKHHALADACDQAIHAIRIFEVIGWPAELVKKQKSNSPLSTLLKRLGFRTES